MKQPADRISPARSRAPGHPRSLTIRQAGADHGNSHTYGVARAHAGHHVAVTGTRGRRSPGVISGIRQQALQRRMHVFPKRTQICRNGISRDCLPTRMTHPAGSGRGRLVQARALILTPKTRLVGRMSRMPTDTGKGVQHNRACRDRPACLRGIGSRGGLASEVSRCHGVAVTVRDER